MAQTGYTPILIYSSSTAAAAPAAGSLTNSTLGSELAINITDGKLFYKDNANAVQVIGWKVVPTTAGGTGLTSYAQGDLLYYNSGTTLTALPKNTSATRYLSNTGSSNNPAWAQVDLTNGVTGTLPVANGGTGTATAFTAGSVIFAGASGVYSQDNANFFWDDTNNRLGVGTTTVNADGIEISKLVGRASPVPAELRLTSTDNGTGWSTTLPWARLTFYDSDTSLGGPKLAASIETIMDAVAGGYSSVYIKTQDTSASPYALKTAVKIDGAQDVTVSNGNLVIGTSGKGIDFSATPGTGTSELFNDYEEGTFTPAFDNLTVGNGTRQGRYTKIGRTVFVEVDFVWGSTTSASGTWYVNNLPFTTAATFIDYGVGNILDSGTENYTCLVLANPSNTLMRPLANNASATYLSNTGVTATVPMTWTTNDAVRMTLVYTT
jgi:hypothetical protein